MNLVAKPNRPHQKRIVLGVSGSIAAYRACDVVRALQNLNIHVKVAMTDAAAHFVTPLTFEALSGSPCLTSVLAMHDGAIGHIEEAYAADLALIAPATANTIAKLAHGLADDAVTTTVLSVQGPVLIAPAMETRMWLHPATTANVATLQQRGVAFIGPVQGALASGREGDGRLAPVSDIVEAVVRALCTDDFRGQKVLVTAGPTVEDLDPVRFLSNRSSGKMGIALARAFAQRKADVVLVHGPIHEPIATVDGLRRRSVRSAHEMHKAVFDEVSRGVDLCVLAAAVADYRATTVANHKRKKDKGGLADVRFEPTEDILAALGATNPRPFLVGFAAETEDVAANAQKKRVRKNCDLICANHVGQPRYGFDNDDNHVIVYGDNLVRDLVPGSKLAVAHAILDVIQSVRTVSPR
jgi:phosphopantothenoylcysteine decarboxylase / phosphopantothenate---cysteine ligase